jgi:chaperonin GroES
MQIKPLYDRVVVKRLAEDTKTASGIIIPETAKEKPQQGEVVAVGQGVYTDKGELRTLQVKVGDKVLFGKWGGTEVKMNGQELIVMKEDDILAVIAN